MQKNLNNILKYTALSIAIATAGGCASAKESPSDMPATAAPAPVPVAVVEEVSYSVYLMALESDESFGFDSSELSSGAMSDLDYVAGAANQFESPTINITGYTDRIGSDDYNMGLSQRRADAVAAYLASKGVPADGIIATGMGSSNPVVGCEGGMSSAEIIECLAPNRRTTVDFPALEMIEADTVSVIKEVQTNDQTMIEMESETLMKSVIVE
jgi:OOP family OmpA-OmpF porin